mmetsp:Transcript_39702/g.102149  ORF Transcript_39702/g.102149 Transcript_39702/m.102149 type:complete len:101 (-) Transcript_39702:108-410(-)
MCVCCRLALAEHFSFSFTLIVCLCLCVCDHCICGQPEVFFLFLFFVFLSFFGWTGWGRGRVTLAAYPLPSVRVQLVTPFNLLPTMMLTPICSTTTLLLCL